MTKTGASAVREPAYEFRLHRWAGGGMGGGKEEEGVGGCNTQNHLKEHSCSLPLHYMLYVVVDLTECGEVFNVQLAPQPSKG